MTITIKGTITDSVTGAIGTFSATTDMTAPAPKPPLPHITPATVTVPAGYMHDALVTHLATDIPATSYTIVSCTPPASFVVYPSGNLRTGDTVAVPSGSYKLMVSASNAAGAGPASEIGVVMTAAAPAPTPTPAPIPPPVPTPTPVHPPVTSGAYDNLKHWPSANNRPVYNAANNSLTWIGPVGGGPSTANDVQQTQVLTNRAGGFTTTRDGEIIENLHVIGGNPGITINHNNCTVRSCFIFGPAGGGLDTSNINVTAGVTGTVIEDCEIDGNCNGGASGSFNILGNPITKLTVRRCNGHTSEQFISRTMQNVTIIDNWMRDPQGPDADMVEMYVDQGNSFDNLIQHNTFDHTSFNAASSNSSINMSNWVSPNSIKGVRVINNRFLMQPGAPYPHIICDDNRQGTGVIEWSCIDNGIQDTIRIDTFWDKDSTLIANSGNFILTDTLDTTITGALVNGTGKI